ncbi:DNA-binding protein YbaB [Hamadaea flava]|uniref:YbaB/EbfC DNA-binding family protein n=1 Tax=Hamadaea flava TaxID=1742688 RepID=A0ABV8LNS4_9ACTN|nr:hypothetical protein [Hamadaea flava]MCP2322734.1 DNA-binding protein YbaB [Hamadaea flava]
MYRQGRDRWRLSDVDLGGDRAQLRQEALAELAEAGGRDYRTPVVKEEADASGLVRVAVDQAGQVVDVHISSDWCDRLGSSGLGPALLAARKNAAAAMARAHGLAALAERERVAAPGPDPDGEWRPVPYAEPLSIEQVWQRLSDNEDRRYRRQKAARAAAEARPRSVGGPLGLLSGQCAGHTLVSVTADAMRAPRADTEQLRHLALELFRQAERREEEAAR